MNTDRKIIHILVKLVQLLESGRTVWPIQVLYKFDNEKIYFAKFIHGKPLLLV